YYVKMYFASLTKQKIKNLADADIIYQRGESYFHKGVVDTMWLEDKRYVVHIYTWHPHNIRKPSRPS
ncbi:hypothetical protein MYX07_06340, partial [Patescibacteria group bacterium AH-259-L07]|nr:hypothetical protein [Patescibacteria group bacterium AH-259-L07]